MKEVSEYGKMWEGCQRKVKVMSISLVYFDGSGDEWRN